MPGFTEQLKVFARPIFKSHKGDQKLTVDEMMRRLRDEPKLLFDMLGEPTIRAWCIGAARSVNPKKPVEPPRPITVCGNPSGLVLHPKGQFRTDRDNKPVIDTSTGKRLRASLPAELVESFDAAGRKQAEVDELSPMTQRVIIEREAEQAALACLKGLSINGIDVMSATPREINAWCDTQERNIDFLRMLASGIPENDPIGKYLRLPDIVEIWKRVNSEEAVARRATAKKISVALWDKAYQDFCDADMEPIFHNMFEYMRRQGQYVSWSKAEAGPSMYRNQGG